MVPIFQELHHLRAVAVLMTFIMAVSVLTSIAIVRRILMATSVLKVSMLSNKCFEMLMMHKIQTTYLSLSLSKQENTPISLSCAGVVDI